MCRAWNRLNSRALAPEVVKIDAPFPYELAFRMFSASSMSDVRTTDSTGPNSSSFSQRLPSTAAGAPLSVAPDVIDLEALRGILTESHLGGVTLDVLEMEPPDPDDPLLSHPDVVITPHAAFYSEEAMAEQQRKAAEQVAMALKGETPTFAVNAEALIAQK